MRLKKSMLCRVMYVRRCNSFQLPFHKHKEPRGLKTIDFFLGTDRYAMAADRSKELGFASSSIK